MFRHQKSSLPIFSHTNMSNITSGWETYKTAQMKVLGLIKLRPQAQA